MSLHPFGRISPQSGTFQFLNVFLNHYTPPSIYIISNMITGRLDIRLGVICYALRCAPDVHVPTQGVIRPGRNWKYMPVRNNY